MKRTALLPVTLLLLLGACGGSSSGSDEATPDPATASTPTTSAPSPKPTAATATVTKQVPPTTTPSQVIDYGDDGVTLVKPTDVSRLTGAPADFKTFIAGQLTKAQKTTDEACTEKPQINVTKIDVGGWAAGGQFIPQCGGNATLWAKADGRWEEAWGGQELVDCKTLKKYGFPADIVGGTCLQGGQEVPYKVT